MSKRRTNERVKEVDLFIANNYPVHGADFCAQALREPISYIRGRVTVKGVGKLKSMRSRHDMEQRLDFLVSLNKELRLENMKLIVESRRLENRNLDNTGSVITANSRNFKYR